MSTKTALSTLFKPVPKGKYYNEMTLVRRYLGHQQSRMLPSSSGVIITCGKLPRLNNTFLLFTSDYEVYFPIYNFSVCTYPMDAISFSLPVSSPRASTSKSGNIIPFPFVSRASIKYITSYFPSKNSAGIFASYNPVAESRII